MSLQSYRGILVNINSCNKEGNGNAPNIVLY